MRNENGYGSVIRLPGNRRRPYAAKVSQMVPEGSIVDENEQKKIDALLKNISKDTLWDIISALHPNDAQEWLTTLLNDEYRKCCFKGKQKVTYIGYYKTKKEAMVALAEWNKYNMKTESLEVTFAEVYHAMLPTLHLDEKSSGTQFLYSSAFDNLKDLHNIPISKIKLQDMQDILDTYSGSSFSVIKKHKIVMKAVFDYAVKHDLAIKNYADYLVLPPAKAPKTRKSFDRDMIKELWNDDTSLAKITLVLCYTGIRIREFLGITSKDIHSDVIWINGTKNASSKRYVPIHPAIAGLIHEVLPCDMPYDKLYRQFRARFPGYTIHCTRHTFSTFSLKMNPVLRDYITGHKSSGITNEVYTHPDVLIPELKEEMNKLEF